MRLRDTRSKDAPPRVRRFWKAVDATPPDPGCEDCDWPRTCCQGCRDREADSLSRAEACC